MGNPVEIENIEDMRRREGIDDGELREKLTALRVGDTVKLTFRTGTKTFAGETLPVRITRSRGHNLQGTLVANPGSPELAKLRRGLSVSFTRDHIHSLPKDQPGQEG